MPTTIQNGYYWSEFLLNIVRSAPAEVTAIPNHIGFGRTWRERPDLVLIRSDNEHLSDLGLYMQA